jgi:hypothetical protein
MRTVDFICKPGLRRVLDAIKNMAAEIEATQRTSLAGGSPGMSEQA